MFPPPNADRWQLQRLQVQADRKPGLRTPLERPEREAGEFQGRVTAGQQKFPGRKNRVRSDEGHRGWEDATQRTDVGQVQGCNTHAEDERDTSGNGPSSFLRRGTQGGQMIPGTPSDQKVAGWIRIRAG